MKIGVEGHFTITIRRADGSVREELKFKNLIVNSGMDRIAGPGGGGSAVAGQPLWDTLVLSTNSIAPTVNDTVMGGATIVTTTASAVYNNTTVSDGASTYQFRMRAGFRFNIGVATGTWSSVGLLFSTGSVLFCKTLIKSGGIPTALTILATESLDIQYELRVLPTLTDSTGSVTINGTSYSWTARVYGINDAWSGIKYNSSIGAETYGSYFGGLAYGASIALGATTAGALSTDSGYPFTGVTETFVSGGNRSPDSRTYGAYTTGSFTRTITAVWSASKVGSSGGVQFNGVWFKPGGCVPCYQFVFSTPIPKAVTEQISLTFTISWTRT